MNYKYREVERARINSQIGYGLGVYVFVGPKQDKALASYLKKS